MSHIVVKCHVVQSSWPVASGARVGWSGAEAGVDGKAEAHRREAPPFSAHAGVRASGRALWTTVLEHDPESLLTFERAGPTRGAAG